MTTKTQALADIINTMKQVKREVSAFAVAAPDAFVVVDTNGLTPFRTDGRQIRLLGERIYTAADFATAHQVAMNLIDVATISGCEMTCVSMKVAVWAPKRINAIDEMIASLSA